LLETKGEKALRETKERSFGSRQGTTKEQIFTMKGEKFTIVGAKAYHPGGKKVHHG